MPALSPALTALLSRSACVALAAAWLHTTAATATQSAANATSSVPLRLIAINDFHGHLEPGDNAVMVQHPDDPTRVVPLRAGGAAYVAAKVNALRAESIHSVFFSAGDLIGASPLVSALFRDEPTVEAMNLMGLAFNAAGNHEFDHGVAELQRMVGGGCATTPRGEAGSCAHPSGRYAGARFPFLAANVVNADGVRLLPATLVKTIDGVRVGFIGAVTRSTPGIVMPAGIRGWRFQAEAAAINAQAAALQAQGVQALVAVIHEGGDTEGGFNDCDDPRGAIFEIARALDPSIDIVFSAHTHRGYNCRVDGRVVIQAASFGRLLSVVDVEIDRASGDIRRERVRATNVPVANGLGNGPPALSKLYPPVTPDANVMALVDHYRQRAAPLADRPVGRIAATFDRRASEGGDHAAGRLIADAHLAATRINGAQIAFTNPGGVRGDLRRRDDGAVSFGDVFTVQPFGNSLVTLTLTGAQLKAMLESQWSRRTDRARFLQPSRGFSYAWREDRPWGERVDPDSLRLAGERIRPERRYRITVNSYLASGGDGFAVLRDAADQVGGPLDVDALAAYLRQQSATAPLAPDPEPRIRRAGP